MGLDPEQLESEIRGGLKNESERLGAAYDNHRFACARFEEYPTEGKSERWRSDSPRRSSPVMQRAVNVLTSNLYKAQPTRTIGDGARGATAGEWLQAVYKASGMGPKWHRLDQLALIGGFAAVQWIGTTDRKAPVRAQVWGAHELVVWTDPDDVTRPDAVATLDRRDGRRRLRLYTRDQVVTYETGKGLDHSAFGGTAYRETGRTPAAGGFSEVRRRDNRHRAADGEGLLPFAFAHWQHPTQEFTTDGPGDSLRALNLSVNDRLDRLGDSIHYLAKPVLIGSGLDESFSLPEEIRPGDVVQLVPAKGLNAGPEQATLAYLLPDLGYVAADWADLNNYLDHSLEMHGIPPVLIRMIQSGARSGASIEAEQTPLLSWVESRRAPWAAYEESCAKVCLQVAAAHLAVNKADAGALKRALAEWSFSLRWPSLYVERPGPERDRSDDRRLKLGLVSKVGLLMERDAMSEAEAFETLKRVKEQNDQLAKLGIDPGSGDPAPFGGGGGFGGFGDDPAEAGDDQAGDEAAVPAEAAAAEAEAAAAAEAEAEL